MYIYIYTIQSFHSSIHFVVLITLYLLCYFELSVRRLSFAYCCTPDTSLTSHFDSDHRFLNNSPMNPKNAFAYFVQRAQARSLVRYAFRTAYQVRDVNTRKELITWARQEFERNRNVEDPVCGQEVKSFTLQSLT